MKITWTACRSGAREIAFLGENEIGFVRLEIRGRFQAAWTCSLDPYPKGATVHRAYSVAGAKAALETHVREWLAKAGLSERIAA